MGIDHIEADFEAGHVAAVVDPAMAGKGVRVIVAVTLATRRKERVESFQLKIRQRPEVVQCDRVAGAVDFFIIAALDDVAAYADFASEVFASDHNVSSYESWFVLGQVKNETKLDLTAA